MMFETAGALCQPLRVCHTEGFIMNTGSVLLVHVTSVISDSPTIWMMAPRDVSLQASRLSRNTLPSADSTKRGTHDTSKQRLQVQKVLRRQQQQQQGYAGPAC
jgi:hypothetical protein